MTDRVRHGIFADFLQTRNESSKGGKQRPVVPGGIKEYMKKLGFGSRQTFYKHLTRYTENPEGYTYETPNTAW